MPHLTEALRENISSPFQTDSSQTLEYLSQGTEVDLNMARVDVHERLRRKDYHPVEEQELAHVETLLNYRLALGEFPQMLDTSFLSGGIKVDTRSARKPQMLVPRFTVHRFYDSPKKFIGRLPHRANTRFEVHVGFNNTGIESRREVEPERQFPLPNAMPSMFMSEYQRLGRGENDSANLPRYTNWNFIARFDLNLILPEQTKEKIVKSRRAFWPGDIYVIPETRPEQWSVDYAAEVRPSEPLIVGVRYGRTYLIDCFDATPAEEYIAREFARSSVKDTSR